MKTIEAAVMLTYRTEVMKVVIAKQEHYFVFICLLILNDVFEIMLLLPGGDTFMGIKVIPDKYHFIEYFFRYNTLPYCSAMGIAECYYFHVCSCGMSIPFSSC